MGDKPLSEPMLTWFTDANTVYPKKYAHGFCFAVLCCGYTLTDFPISIRLTSLALWQSNDCPSASKATLMNMDKYFMWIHYERSHNHNKAKHNKTVCIFLGIYCMRHQGGDELRFRARKTPKLRINMLFCVWLNIGVRPLITVIPSVQSRWTFRELLTKCPTLFLLLNLKHTVCPWMRVIWLSAIWEIVIIELKSWADIVIGPL